LGEWPETTDDEGSMNDHSSQSQQDDEHLSREEERRRVLTSDWSDVKDEEECSESGSGAMHPSRLRELDWSASQHEALDNDIWSMPVANYQSPTPQLINSWSGTWKQGGELDSDNWMTPFAPADCKVPGWFSDDQWFGNGQCDSRGQFENDGDSTGWFSEAAWFNEQGSKDRWPEKDCWMTPFDELIQWTAPHAIAASDASTRPSMNSPIGPAVCIWNAGSNAASEAGGDSSEGKGAAEIFTNGKQVFQPGPSASGQPLFTDDKQLYASVCVVVGPPDEAVDPTSVAA